MILFKQLPQRSPDGTVLQAYQWDAKNRLVKILEGMQETEFAYDGKDRRVLKIERTHGSEISRTHYIWEGSNIVQSRAADASTLQRNYFQQGFQENAQNYYYTKSKPKGSGQVFMILSTQFHPTVRALLQIATAKQPASPTPRRVKS